MEKEDGRERQMFQYKMDLGVGGPWLLVEKVYLYFFSKKIKMSWSQNRGFIIFVVKFPSHSKVHNNCKKMNMNY